MSLGSRCWPLLVWLPLAGCSQAKDPPAPSASADQECSGEFDVFEAGMTRQAQPGDVSVQLEDSEPAPPVVRKDNVWWLRLSDAEGAAILGAELHVTPYMPAHLHGSAEVVIEELGDGEYKLSPIELIMPGVWEIPISVTPPDGETSQMTFRFCIAEL